MSERGTWLSGRIYCKECRLGFLRFLELTGAAPPPCRHWSGLQFAPGAFCGEIGGLYGGEELHYWETELLEALGQQICHPVRIAVLADEGERMYEVRPKGSGTASQS